MVQQERLSQEWELFHSEHERRLSFDTVWFLSLWDRTFPDDAFRIACWKGQAGFVPHPVEGEKNAV